MVLSTYITPTIFAKVQFYRWGTEAQRGKVTCLTLQLMSVRGKIWTQRVWLQSPCSFSKYMFIDFREREKEKHWCERETSIGCLPYVLWLGIKPPTCWCAGWCSNQLSHTGKGQSTCSWPLQFAASHMIGSKFFSSFPLLTRSSPNSIVQHTMSYVTWYISAFSKPHPCPMHPDQVEEPHICMPSFTLFLLPGILFSSFIH